MLIEEQSDIPSVGPTDMRNCSRRARPCVALSSRGFEYLESTLCKAPVLTPSDAGRPQLSALSWHRTIP